MSKFHELLASEGDVKSQYAIIHAETLGVMAKPHLFTGTVKTLSVVKPGVDEPTKLAMEAAGSAKQELTTTVDQRLKYHGDYFVRRVNLQLQKEMTNQTAKADLIVNGLVVAKDLPATFLLSLEQMLVEERKIYAAAPTLAAGIQWIAADQQGEGIFRNANPVKSTTTEKSLKVISVAKATDKHPEQVEKINIDIAVGLVTAETFSGMWTSARKAEVMARCDMMIAAVKEARARANGAEVIGQNINIGASLLAFIESKPVSATK